MVGKIVITGPGRSGTTMLVQLLGHLGFDTGWDPGEEPYVDAIRAGCEWNTATVALQPDSEVVASIEAAPRVIKSPEWALVLKYLLARGMIAVDVVLVPVRDLDVAARSRLSAGLDWLVGDEVNGDERVVAQANVHAIALGRVIEACLIYEVPCVLLRFPAFVRDAEYCWHKLRDVFELDEGAFMQAFDAVARPELVRCG